MSPNPYNPPHVSHPTPTHHNPASNSGDEGSSSYEWVYYDVEECKSCSSSDSNDMYGANDLNHANDFEYYDEVTASDGLG